MDRQLIIDMHKSLLLSTRTLPTVFLVERKGVSLRDMDTLSRFDNGEHDGALCFMLGRHTAQERHWKAAEVLEVAYVAIQKQDSKEHLVFVFCALYPEPAFVQRLIEIRRAPGGGNIALLDDGEFQPNTYAALPAFVAGVGSSELSALQAAIILLAARSAKE